MNMPPHCLLGGVGKSRGALRSMSDMRLLTVARHSTD